jgi:hypothetical protein
MSIHNRSSSVALRTTRASEVPGPALEPAVPAPAAEKVDAYARGSTVTAPPLPDVLMKKGDLKVQHGTDPGDFYCEHMFFLTQQHALKANSGAVRNAQGEVLVGFLHVPMDAHTEVQGATYTQAARHAGTRQVVGAALRGYLLEALAQVHQGPVRLMLNGYDTFMSVKDNPTGNFTSHAENVNAAMRRAFGDALLTGKGRALDNGVLEYRVKDPRDGKERAIQIQTHRWPVSDETIGGGPASVQKALEAFRPHAVLSMGVASDAYLAEWNADDGGLRRGRAPRHEDGRAPSVTLPENRSLARAIVRGNQPLKTMNRVAAFVARGAPVSDGG